MLRRQFLMFTAGSLAVGWPTVARAQIAADRLIPRTTARRYGLERSWFAQAAIDRNRTKVHDWNLDDDLLLIQSTQNTVEALDPETGRRLWAERVGRAGVPSEEPTASMAGVAVLNADKLMLLDRQSGRTLWEFRLPAPALTSPVVTDEWVYMGMLNGRMSAFPVEDPKFHSEADKQSWFHVSAGSILTTPVITREFVAWASDRGRLYASDFQRRRLLFQFEAAGRLGAPLAYWPPYLYMVDDRNYLYAVRATTDATAGRLTWQYNVGGAVKYAPVALDGVVYVAREDGGLLAILTETETNAEQFMATEGEDGQPTEPKQPGSLIWYAPRIKRFLAASPTKVYAEDHLGGVVILDRSTGARLGELPGTETMLKLSNTATDRLYLVSPGGLVQAFHELELTEPFRHAWPSLDDGQPAAINVGE